jgi:hypothetical protein
MARLTYRCEGSGGPTRPAVVCVWTPLWFGRCQSVRGTIRAKFETWYPADGVLEYFVRGESRGRWLLPRGAVVYINVPLTCADLNVEHKISISGAVPGPYTWSAEAYVEVEVAEQYVDRYVLLFAVSALALAVIAAALWTPSSS